MDELLMTVSSECLTFYAIQPSYWLLCRQAKHVTAEGQVTTCVLLVGSWHSHVRGPFLSFSAALVAKAGVRCTACIRICDRTVSDYSVAIPTFLPSPSGEGTGVKASWRMDVVTRACGPCGWWSVWRCYSWKWLC